MEDDIDKDMKIASRELLNKPCDKMMKTLIEQTRKRPLSSEIQSDCVKQIKLTEKQEQVVIAILSGNQEQVKKAMLAEEQEREQAKRAAEEQEEKAMKAAEEQEEREKQARRAAEEQERKDQARADLRARMIACLFGRVP